MADVLRLRECHSRFYEELGSLGCSERISGSGLLVAADRRENRNDHDRNDDREAALGAGDLFVRFIVGGARVTGTPGALG